ncbi:hypothetical protein SCALM49S_01376 [Streptomyces californicus]
MVGHLQPVRRLRTDPFMRAGAWLVVWGRPGIPSRSGV